MREIIFRGKNANTGDWEYGYVIPAASEIKLEIARDKGGPGYVIDVSTLGQYTGIVDRKNMRIFEGDIVRDTKDSIEGVLCYVAWLPAICGFALVYERNDRPMGQRNRGSGLTFDPYLEVVGNIYENMDLLYKPPVAALGKTGVQ